MYIKLNLENLFFGFEFIFFFFLKIFIICTKKLIDIKFEAVIAIIIISIIVIFKLICRRNDSRVSLFIMKIYNRYKRRYINRIRYI